MNLWYLMILMMLCMSIDSNMSCYVLCTRHLPGTKWLSHPPFPPQAPRHHLCTGSHCTPWWHWKPLGEWNDSPPTSGWWLGHPSEKYESQLGWWHSQYMGKFKGNQTTNQYMIRKKITSDPTELYWTRWTPWPVVKPVGLMQVKARAVPAQRSHAKIQGFQWLG